MDEPQERAQVKYAHRQAVSRRLLQPFNAVLRSYLEAYADAGGREQVAIADLIALSLESTAGRGAATWTRDELHER